MDNLNIKRNIQPFNGEKYSFWKTRIRQLFTELKVLEVIDNERTTDIEEEKWNKKERIAKGVIVDYLADSMLSIITPSITPKEIFKHLDEMYERKSAISQVSIRKKLLTLKLQGEAPLIKHFILFEDLISQLIATGEAVSESDKIAHLLITMPNQYAGVITALETLSPDNLTLAFVKSRLLDQEVKLKEENKDTSAKVLQIETFKKKNFKKSFAKNRFNRKTHYPNRSKNFKPRSKSGVKCYFCGREGHIKKDCIFYKREQERTSDNDNQRKLQTIQNAGTSNSSESFLFMAGN